jgi:prepilin-type N-terminal cleavage/methylation domain-containing protein
MRAVPPRLTFTRGFTLTEMAMVLFIIALLMGSLMLPLSAQDDARKSQETAKTLIEVQNALLGFAAATGRLPCPAIAPKDTLNDGMEEPIGGGVCSLLTPGDVTPVGFLPAATLGLISVDGSGLVLDGWGNPIRYGVTTANASAFTRVNGMASAGMTALTPNLVVCPTASAGGNDVQNSGTATANCPAGVSPLTNTAVAVIYSLGPNGAVGGAGTDESHNPNPNTAVAADRVFISHERAASTSANGEFDDIVVWLSPNILFNRMIAAGRLP